jgi:thiol-disulfide isomerase/thioredoxin
MTSDTRNELFGIGVMLLILASAILLLSMADDRMPLPDHKPVVVNPVDPVDPAPEPQPQPKPEYNAELIVYGAKWCGPCADYEAALDRAELKRTGYAVRLIDGDMHPEPSVTAYPTTILRQGEREVGRFTGAVTNVQLYQWLTDQWAKGSAATPLLAVPGLKPCCPGGKCKR